LSNEAEMYGPVVRWLRAHLRGRHPRSRLVVADTHNSYLSQTLRRLDLASRFPDSDLWQVKVDIVGVALSAKRATLAIVECKARRPALKDLCQLLGYSRLMKPDLALLLSPAPPSDPLASPAGSRTGATLTTRPSCPVGWLCEPRRYRSAAGRQS